MVRAKKYEARDWFYDHLYFETDECIIWPFWKNKGYGYLNLYGKMERISILVCEEHYGTKPDDYYDAAHGPCNNHACMNYRHLSWKTHQENCLDRQRDGTDNIVSYNLKRANTVKSLSDAELIFATTKPPVKDLFL
jgi:hypothetical protein